MLIFGNKNKALPYLYFGTMSEQNGFQRRRALIQSKFNEKYQQVNQSKYVTVNLSLIYQDVAQELGFTPGHVRNVVKGYK